MLYNFFFKIFSLLKSVLNSIYITKTFIHIKLKTDPQWRAQILSVQPNTLLDMHTPIWPPPRPRYWTLNPGDALTPSPSSYQTRHRPPRATTALSSITKVSSSCFGTSPKWSDITTTFSEVRKILINILTRRALGMHASRQQTGSLHSGRRCCRETAGHSEMLRVDKSKTDL